MTVLFPVGRRPPRPYRRVGNQENAENICPRVFVAEQRRRIQGWHLHAEYPLVATRSHSNLAGLPMPLRVFCKIPRNMAPTSMTVTPQTESGCRAEQMKTPRGRFAMHQNWDRWTPRGGETTTRILGQTLIGVRH